MMDPNEFITKIKANNSVKDITDLVKVYDEYKVILDKVATKDRAPFSLNVLCILCRNLEKAPRWRDSVDSKSLLVLSIDCVRETRAMERADRVKTLACVYHIHRHAVKQNASIPPELVFKISLMPFELDSKHLLQEYAKTYWNILVDRLAYIERLRTKIPIVKLLSKLTDDLQKIVDIYDTVQFCTTIIVFIVKKLHYLYNEKHAKELNQTFAQLFTRLAMKDTKPFKTLNRAELMEIYTKLNECLYIVAENASKNYFKDNPLESIVRTCINIVGHSPDLFHCFQTFYTNTFCSLLTKNTDLNYSENVLNSLLLAFDTTERLGENWMQALSATYPFLNQFMRLYIEFNVANSSKKPWKDNFNVQLQLACLKIILTLMDRLENCEQLLKCDSCLIRSGLHDSLRLSFLVKHFITVSLSQNLLITDILPQANLIITKQYQILDELKKLGCVNYEKCFRKLQTDIHNTSICLNKAKHYEFSIKLFNIYIEREVMELSESKNISRALYNKSICELDSKLFQDALLDAFLSLVFANDLSSEKYMSLVMDIKAKELKAQADDARNEELQLISVADACRVSLERRVYGDVEPFLRGSKFSKLLTHEFMMYSKLWPSVMPIAGVWRSLLELTKGNYVFTDETDEATTTLHSVIAQTPTVVRTVCGEHFQRVINELIDNMQGKTLSADEKIVFSTLLFLKTEMDLEAASQKYGWKSSEPVQVLDPDQVPANRTVPQEFAATQPAVQAVGVLTELAPDFGTVSRLQLVGHALPVLQVMVQRLFLLSRDLEAAQLAVHCCALSDLVQDSEAFVRNAGTLLYHSTASEELARLMSAAARKEGVSDETYVIFICDASIYQSRAGSIGLAARLLQMAQDRILAAYEADPEINLDLAVGRLLEAQTSLCRDSATGPSALSAVNWAQRHYLSIPSTGSSWYTRRLRSGQVSLHGGAAARRAAACLAALARRSRARAAAAAGLPRAPAAARAMLYALITDVHSMDDAQIKIDNRLKHFLGLQPSNETQPYYTATETKKAEPFTPKKEVETMLENLVFKKSQISPSIPCFDVPAFKMPDFFNHTPKCNCYACSMPICFILACETCGLEASMYFRANENDIARNYFNGVVKMFGYVEAKFRTVKARYLEVYDAYLVESVMKFYWDEFRTAKVKVLIDLAFFELRNSDYVVADEHIVEIHEVMREISSVDGYLSNEVMNLMTCSAQLRKIIRKPEALGLEDEFEGLKLSPAPSNQEPPMTPVTKPCKPPKPATKQLVKDEELPKKRKVIKLNLDNGAAEEKEPKATKPEFKIPVPVATKHVLEAATPRTRRKPQILVTQPSEDTATPNTTKLDFSTPKDMTPEQFFTPMTSVKTYAKQSLRRNIVKNLEQEFSTPVSNDKENKQTNVNASSRDLKEKKETVSVNDRDTVKETSQKERSVRDNLKEPVKKRDSVKETLKERTSVKEAVTKAKPANLEVPQKTKKKEVVRSLKRATSPGKLAKEPREMPKDARGRRLRKPIKLSLDEDDIS